MNEDKVIQKLAEHDKRFDEISTDLSGFKNQVYTAQDEMLTILRRLDEERIFTTKWVERIEKEVEGHKQEIAKMKSHLKIN